jgi:hypothetical protein
MNLKIILQSILGTLLLIQPGFSSNASRSKQSETEVKQYCRGIAALTKPAEALVFADTGKGAEPVWRQFATESSLNDALGNSIPPRVVALVWTHDRKVIEANFTFQSESTDWAKYSNHCFRADGSLARIQSTLNTFHGNVTEVSVTEYSKSGKHIKKTVRYFDLNTHRAIKPPAYFLPQNTPVYMRVNDLPFATILKKNNSAKP